MATVTRTWDFPTDAMGLTGSVNASVNFGWVSGDLAVQFTCSVKALVNSNKLATRSGTGETWETWGVPPGGSVTGLRVTGWQKRLSSNTGLSAATLKLRVLGAGGTTVHPAGDLINAALPISPAATPYSAGAAGSLVAVGPGSQASTTDVRLQIDYTISTSSSVTVQANYRFKAIALEITYTPAGGGGPPAAATPAALLMAM